MTPSANLILGIAFAVVGITAAILQFWLWTFPMELDPTGRDPNGRTTAPKGWRMVHRFLGYVFAALYVVLVVQMIPRLPFLVASESGVWVWIHTVLGLIVLPVLVFKVAIIRIWQKWGKALPAVGAFVTLSGVILIAAILAPISQISSWPAKSLQDRKAKAIIESRCFSCHGASVLLRREDKEWGKVLDEMTEIASESGRPDPVGGERDLLVAYLSRIMPTEDDDD